MLKIYDIIVCFPVVFVFLCIYTLLYPDSKQTKFSSELQAEGSEESFGGEAESDNHEKTAPVT